MMKASHAGLGISETEWQARANHSAAALGKFKVLGKEKDEVLAFATTRKAGMVEQ